MWSFPRKSIALILDPGLTLESPSLLMVNDALTSFGTHKSAG